MNATEILDQLRVILDEMRAAPTAAAKHDAYYRSLPMLTELSATNDRGHDGDRGYVREKLVVLKEQLACSAELNEHPGQNRDDHHAWAIGSLSDIRIRMKVQR